MDPFIGEIRIFAGNYAPYQWAFCNGDILQIRQYTALFSLLGTYYGGDGRNTFALPDLRGRVPLHWGNGPGLTPRSLGEFGGNATVTLTTAQMPQHSHVPQGQSATGQNSPASAVWAASATGRTPPKIYGPGTPTLALSPQAIAPAGSNQPHNNCSPYLALNYIIALQGLFPPRQ